jgi:3-oxoacyl-[acyl-carrier-protein] synthase-3
MISPDRAAAGIGVAGTGNYLPGTAVTIDDYVQAGLQLTPMDNGPLLRAPRLRHHIAPGERASEMIEQAARPMLARLGVDPARDIDILLTNVLLPDDMFTGCGADTANRLGMSPEWIIDVHNGGCASFQYMLKLATAMIASGSGRSALIANVQNTAGQIFDLPGNRLKSHCVSAGDGCGVAYVTAGARSPILGAVTRNTPETARHLAPVRSDGQHYWQSSAGTLDVRFDPDQAKNTMELGNRLIPEVVRELGGQCGFTMDQIDVLITNQPNRIFLKNWRTGLGLPEDRHVDTYDRFGNLYGAGVPVTLHDAVTAGRVRPGDLVVMAGFAHAGDFAAAAAIRW